ncbi:MAG: M15 family metallopeptidase [Treponema sp.]
MTKSSVVNKTFLLLIILFSVQDFVFAKRSFFEPSDISIFRKAYPDVEFESEYDNELSDWKIIITENDEQTVLYWAEGRMLPKDKLSNEEYYSKILYSYPTKIPDPKNFTEEDITKIREYSSSENRQSSGGTPQFFFDAIYDCNTQGSTEKHIVKLTFLGKKVNLHERMKEPLSKVEKEIKELAKKDSEVNNFVKKLSSASGYYWRTIRDSGNKSFHSLGIAVDILPVGWNQKNIYWGWRRDLDPDNWMKTPLDRRWMPPKKVVDIFEKYGFIWGGKWVIWDNMHFEYHPELILYREKENNIHFPFMIK